jgi:hypothetical protein
MQSSSRREGNVRLGALNKRARFGIRIDLSRSPSAAGLEFEVRPRAPAMLGSDERRRRAIGGPPTKAAAADDPRQSTPLTEKRRKSPRQAAPSAKIGRSGRSRDGVGQRQDWRTVMLRRHRYRVSKRSPGLNWPADAARSPSLTAR